ncbi:AbrB/MazE/SpoVT family DNA-binding domain-containing protein [Bradyrhizobium sp. OK095]|jgi:putative addiction module antidote|uniref:AbrB/MazE/SpoVT family DNA-binding domain-containing protein n=1 Tax=Bradyrhizobium sp. OK095 TaxID=1882760 RepID=UPI0008CD9E10|nr:AbrB/MazE/SpoVT family DNA-binding domain-containing protein [Bradyrhizobium sp. OK095]SEO12003.1 putative addiction module antidote [Bradyrhizobium sp. OK095]
MNASPKDVKSESTVLQVRKIGNSIGVILPKELAARLNLKEGDKLFPVEQPDGGFLLTPHDPDFEKAMEVARRGMKRYHNALAELAK